MTHALAFEVPTAISRTVYLPRALPPAQLKRRTPEERARRAAVERERRTANRPTPVKHEPIRYEVADMTANLVAVGALITESERAAGCAWYPSARRTAEEFSALFGAPVERVVAVIAHLSPRTHWVNNLGWAKSLLEACAKGRECPRVAVRRQRDKAWKVARGEASPESGHGPKTAAFFRSILGDRDAVCVDVWALRAALGRADAGGKGVAERVHAKVAEAYRRAAQVVGLAPRDFQAAVWIHVRGAAD